MGSRKPARDAEPARWLTERLTTFGENVLSVVPSGFEAYARVLHPASRVTHTSETPLRWAEVAALTGRTAHRAVQWPSLQGANPVLDDESVLGPDAVWVRGPEMGTLPLEVARTLWPVLRPYTGSDECFFAVWEGFGFLPRAVLDAPAFEIPERQFHLFTGALSDVEESFCADDPGSARAMSVDVLVMTGSQERELETESLPLSAHTPPYQSANLWWPEDRTWCVATEIDLVSTYLAGSQRLIDAVLACKELETYQVEPSDGVAYDGDTVNPKPKDRDVFALSFRLE